MPTQSTSLFDNKKERLKKKIATKVANLILHAGEKEVEEALQLAKDHPEILTCEVIAKDRLDRKVKGTLLSIAAMAGDINIQKYTPYPMQDKDKGVVERLISLGTLPREEITKQLSVITSSEAMLANKQANERMLNAIETFSNKLIELTVYKHFNRHCEPLIAKLKHDLQPNTTDIHTNGFIYDPTILYLAVMWFKNNYLRFGNPDIQITPGEKNTISVKKDKAFWKKADVFWVTVFGELQRLLSARDAQMMLHGISHWGYDFMIPPRTLHNADGLSYFSRSSGLGEIFYLGYFPETMPQMGHLKLTISEFSIFLKLLINLKKEHVAMLINHTAEDSAKHKRCVTM